MSITYTASSSSPLASAAFGFLSETGVRRVAMSTGSSATSGPATITVAPAWEIGGYALADVTLTDAAGRFQTYNRDGTAEFGPGGASGVTTHALSLKNADYNVMRKPAEPTAVTANPSASGALVTWSHTTPSGTPVHAFNVIASPGGASASTSGGAAPSSFPD